MLQSITDEEHRLERSDHEPTVGVWIGVEALLVEAYFMTKHSDLQLAPGASDGPLRWHVMHADMTVHQEGLISCGPELVCGDAPLNLEIEREARIVSISNTVSSLDLTSSSPMQPLYHYVKHQPCHIKLTQAGLAPPTPRQVVQGFLDLGLCKGSKDEILSGQLNLFPLWNWTFAEDGCARCPKCK
ncbi:uncharacterized protein HD556DRAFT_1314731 [Suillus plorans]|uniref:Uncharacterized protein n=1 Tax=Suillus plorans TaxID=116603 RepID=A0A9P7DAD2_9AGAM|nr:uncharacterized protein HD556DRAFT_1314731 [Suillus plorans]KAG1784877.1 hypothetical protein HD556DRAFT_1314731 [Suillus plorans]